MHQGCRATRVGRAALTVVLAAAIVTTTQALAPASASPDLAQAAPAVTATATSSTAELVAARQAAAQAAQVALTSAGQIKAAAAGSAVPAERLTALDDATTQVQAMVAQVLAEPSPSGSTNSTATPGASASGTAGATSLPTASGAVADPTATSAADGTEAAAGSSVGQGATSDSHVADGAPTPVATSAPPTPTAAATTPAPPATLAVTTPQTLPDPAADDAGILDVGTTVVDQVRAAMPAADVSDPDVQALLVAIDALAVSAEQIGALAEADQAEADLQAAAAQAQAAAQAAKAAALAAARKNQAARLSADAHSLDAYPNGQIPLGAMCAPAFAPSAHLRCDAAGLLDGLDQAYYAQFGSHLTITGSYRSLDAQIECTATKGPLCAEPGTSRHGLGLAVDLGAPAGVSGTPEHAWMLANVLAYGWLKPDWSLDTGGKPEPWHFEFTGAPAG